jgi:hypothetical protein
VGLERGPLSLISTIEELLGRKSSGSGLENRDSSPTSGGRSVGIVCLRTKATEFLFIVCNVPFIICVVLCAVFCFEHGVILCDTCIFVFCLIVVPLPPGKNHIFISIK